MVTWQAADDPWLGSLHSFPRVFHGRASFRSDLNVESLQKCLVQALYTMLTVPVSREISVADLDGYIDGRILFRIGVGNGDGFDILDARERERVFSRIENVGAFDLLDLSFHLRYSIRDGRAHKLRGDEYLVRLVFRPERVELLLHHVKGVRRVGSRELVQMIVSAMNLELARGGSSSVELEEVSSS
jgi:hypothetical protein